VEVLAGRRNHYIFIAYLTVLNRYRFAENEISDPLAYLTANPLPSSAGVRVSFIILHKKKSLTWLNAI